MYIVDWIGNMIDWKPSGKSTEKVLNIKSYKSTTYPPTLSLTVHMHHSCITPLHLSLGQLTYQESSIGHHNISQPAIAASL